MASSIRRAATNHYQISLAYLYESAPKIFTDERLKATNPALFETLEQYLTEILLHGTPVQRNAILESLGSNCDISMPEIRYMGMTAGTGLIQKYIIETCQILGCDFKGDLPTVASMLYDDYGGMTIIEWSRFLQRIAKGEYRDEYQSVNTRGLNAEFLRDWIEQFDATRGDIVQKLRKELPDQPVTEPQNAPTFEQIRQFQREAVALDSEVHNWRTEYESGLTVRRVEKVRDERKDADGKTVIYEYDTPIIEDSTKAAYTRLYDFLAMFYGFTGVSIRDAINDLTVVWELERVTLDIEVEAPKFYRARSKTLLNELKKFVLENHRGLLMAGLKMLAAANPTTAAFIKALTGNDYSGDKPYTAIEQHLPDVATKLIREFHDHYGDDARAQIAADSFVLYRQEYIAFRCIHHAVTIGGLQHPFTKIFNIEQQ